MADSREVAFRQLQENLADKDMKLAELMASTETLQTKVHELTRVAKREDVNMDYLKNIVLQYITFPVQAPEKLSLIPVLAMLLQFSQEELKTAENALKYPQWTGKAPIEIDLDKIASRSTHGRTPK